MEESRKNLLIVSSGFPDKSGEYLAHTFVKGYVDEARFHFNSVMVLVLLPYVPKLFRKYVNKNSKALKDYTYENIRVVYKMYPYLPFWPLTKYKGKIAYLFLSSKFLKLIKENPPIIHANFTSPAGVFANLLSKKIKGDFILTVHEDHEWLIEEIKENNKLLIDTWESAKVVIRVNKLDNAILSQFNKSIVTIPNGFNHRKFKALSIDECKNKLNIVSDKKILVNIGFYKEQKNQKLLIDAINLLSIDIKNNLKCFIIGGGLKHDELVEYVDMCNLNSIVNIVGQVKHDKLPLYLNVADIFCLSSNSEGNPTVMFEALGIGIPYVGTNVGGVPEIIISDKYGLMCEPNNKIKLKEIIEKGLKKNWNRDEIIEYAECFSWESIFLKTKKYY